MKISIWTMAFYVNDGKNHNMKHTYKTARNMLKAIDKIVGKSCHMRPNGANMGWVVMTKIPGDQGRVVANYEWVEG